MLHTQKALNMALKNTLFSITSELHMSNKI